MRRILRVLDRIEELMAGSAILLLAGITIAVCMEVFMRYALRDPIIWVVELAEYALLYICFLGTAWALARGQHIRIDIFLGAFPPRWRQRFGVASSILGLCVALILTIWGGLATWEKFVSGAYKPTVIEFPSWIVLLCIPVGSFFLCLRFLRNAIGYASGEIADRTDYRLE